MNAPLIAPDLSHNPPRSPRERVAGFAIALRAADLYRAEAAGTLGAYKTAGPLDWLFLSFKELSAEDFREAVLTTPTADALGEWILSHGREKTALEIRKWSEKMETYRPIENPSRRAAFVAACKRLGLSPEKSSLFDMLEAHDHARFHPRSANKNRPWLHFHW